MRYILSITIIAIFLVSCQTVNPENDFESNDKDITETVPEQEKVEDDKKELVNISYIVEEINMDEDTTVFGFWNFNSEINEIENGVPVQVRTYDTTDPDPSYSTYVDYHKGEYTKILASHLIRTKTNFDSDILYDRPHVAIPFLNKERFSMGFSFNFDNSRSRGQQRRYNIHPNDEVRSAYGDFYKDVWDTNWHNLPKEEKTSANAKITFKLIDQLIKEKCDELGIISEKKEFLRIIESGFVGRWFNVAVHSIDGKNFELVFIFNNERHYYQTGLILEKKTDHELFLSYNHKTEILDYYVDGKGYQMSTDFEYFTLCAIGGDENFRIIFMPQGAYPAGMDWFTIMNGTRTYEEFIQIRDKYLKTE